MKNKSRTSISEFESDKPSRTYAKFKELQKSVSYARKEFTSDPQVNKMLKEIEERVNNTFESFQKGE